MVRALLCLPHSPYQEQLRKEPLLGLPQTKGTWSLSPMAQTPFLLFGRLSSKAAFFCDTS